MQSDLNNLMNTCNSIMMSERKMLLNGLDTKQIIQGVMANTGLLNLHGITANISSASLLDVIRQGKHSLIDLGERIMGYIGKHTNKAYIITGNPRREERWDYPMDALREIVINMIVHRDYRSANDSTIKIFDDRIEFFNTGTLLDDLTVNLIKTGKYKSHLRNKQILTLKMPNLLYN